MTLYCSLRRGQLEFRCKPRISVLVLRVWRALIGWRWTVNKLRGEGRGVCEGGEIWGLSLCISTATAR
jgi:hypothetical protein